MRKFVLTLRALMLLVGICAVALATRAIWMHQLAAFFLNLILFGAALFVLVHWFFESAVQELAASIRSIRSGDTEAAQRIGFLKPLTSEIAKVSASLRAARRAAAEEARVRLEKLDAPWTAERLHEFIAAYLKERPMFVVSNREPYVHTRVGDTVRSAVPPGGVVTALEPVMEACGGTWLAHGSGNADRETADKEGKLRVPPEEPKYTLKRVFLTQDEVHGYYDGFSNEALWPLSHMAHTRPLFREEDWVMYRKVNGIFARVLLEEIRHVERPLVLVNDYHFALLPQLIKKSRPDAQAALFWHIPWPSAEKYSICPWRKEILEGMLGADLVGFHTQHYCNNFLDTVGAEIESLIDFEHFSVTRGGHHSFIKPFPISIAFPGPAEPSGVPDAEAKRVLGARGEALLAGVDRLDYTKGLLERFKALEFFLERHPEFRSRATLLQIAAPSRESVEKYRQYAGEVLAEAQRINDKFASGSWRPIVLEARSFTHAEVQQFYQRARVGIVTSLSDGMNLVAKEYVASRTGEDGVLILSKFTGASRDLKQALIVNPYSAEETSDAIYRALTMPESEQRRRMKAMRESVRDYNVYRWSAELIQALAGL